MAVFGIGVLQIDINQPAVVASKTGRQVAAAILLLCLIGSRPSYRAGDSRKILDDPPQAFIAKPLSQRVLRLLP
jgi:hypothetical protein